jgi:hypothetical protein
MLVDPTSSQPLASRARYRRDDKIRQAHEIYRLGYRETDQWVCIDPQCACGEPPLVPKGETVANFDVGAGTRLRLRLATRCAEYGLRYRPDEPLDAELAALTRDDRSKRPLLARPQADFGSRTLPTMSPDPSDEIDRFRSRDSVESG